MAAVITIATILINVALVLPRLLSARIACAIGWLAEPRLLIMLPANNNAIDPMTMA